MRLNMNLVWMESANIGGSTFVSDIYMSILDYMLRALPPLHT